MSTRCRRGSHRLGGYGTEQKFPGMEDCRKLMAADSKRRLVREFLYRQLPECMVSDTCDPDPQTLAFEISTSSHSSLLKIRTCFVKDKNSRFLIDMLDQINIAYLIKQHPDIDVIVISYARAHT